MTKRHHLLAAALTVTLAGCGNTEPAAQPSPAASRPSAVATAPPADRDNDGIPNTADLFPDDPTNIRRVVLDCGPARYAVLIDPNKGPDFTQIWSAKASSCDADTAVTPTTPLEQQAYKASGYIDNDVETLYTICAENDPTEMYTEEEYAASVEQIAELTGALTLCPKHPLGARWKQAIARGSADAKLTKEGRLFADGTYLVGSEIKPGTYVVTDVKGCYWERQNRDGGTIDNYFTAGARRVQVTIRSTDYAFHAEGCGEWRPK
ncbi:hypothetical protein OG792_07890 [Micromonospora sp. NBC_01699]|uniref:hypothetical protein n=1 Tax=Micromonospora sp. NBC_01699 TaxID=2975984 RepID=UPI002E36CBBD|nr:hypothetical protein [Micromonospora sp. NBC_01699]